MMFFYNITVIGTLALFRYGNFFASDIEGVDHEVASTEWKKTRRCQ